MDLTVCPKCGAVRLNKKFPVKVDTGTAIVLFIIYLGSADFIMNDMYTDKKLMHSYRNGKSSILVLGGSSSMPVTAFITFICGLAFIFI